MNLYNQSLSIVAASLVAISAPQAAFAQNTDDLFTGVSVGVQGGYDRQSIDETILEGANAVTLNAKKSGIIYGGYLGYDLQMGKVVVGVEAGFSPNGKTITSDIANGGSAELNPKWSADASVRAGVVLADRALFYGRIGYNRKRYSVSRFANGNNSAIASSNENADGLMFGGGAEFAFNENAAFRVEYRRNKLDGSLRSNQVLAGATLRF
ncbi:MAG: outer membrane beta-barrel protein [Parasphingorhabdus sp.]|uniref:outer membrane protein n=1 Tax=Parasphingorhabdus sp. TaxID=2709688 RepID=UPI0032668483